MGSASRHGAPSGGSVRVPSPLSDCWQHRAPFLASLGITLAAVTIYLFPFLDYLAEAPLPEWDGVFTLTHNRFAKG
jgi:hypothetical protein